MKNEKNVTQTAQQIEAPARSPAQSTFAYTHYRSCHGHAFKLRLPGCASDIDAAPDVAAQLLDKSTADAVDFSASDPAMGLSA